MSKCAPMSPSLRQLLDRKYGDLFPDTNNMEPMIPITAMTTPPMTDAAFAEADAAEDDWRGIAGRLEGRLRELERSHADLVATMREVMTVMEEQAPPLLAGNAPGHAHRTPGVWDASGEPCHWCHLWARAKSRLNQLRAEEVHP